MSGRVTIGTFRGAAAVSLRAGELEATFLPGVGMLGVSLRHRGDELLALPGGLAAYRAGHVMGLPLLAPWANRLGSIRYRANGVTVDVDGLPLHTDDNGIPIHGTMTAQLGWEVESLRARGASAVLEVAFDYGARPDLLAAFPFPHRIGLRAEVSPASLSMATTVTATGNRAVPVTLGWHPYFRLPGAPRRSWLLGIPGRRHLALDTNGLPTGDSAEEAAERAPIGRRTFDDLYALETARPELSLEGGGRRVTVAYGEGYRYAQIFVPPGQTYACLEPMTAPTNALVSGTYTSVEPGDAATALFAIKVA